MSLFSNFGYASGPSNSIVNTASFSILSIGINRNERNVVPAVRVRGEDDGKQAVNLEHWSIPFDAVTHALGIKVRYLDNGQLELRSLEITTRISEQELRKDNELGAALSVADIKRLFGIDVSFDIGQYALVFKSELLTSNAHSQEEDHKAVSFDGLASTPPETFNFSALSQQIRMTGQKDTINLSGDLVAVGNFKHSSWYIDVNQKEIDTPESWRLKDLQNFWKYDDRDWVVGSQPTFWQNQSGGDYWGVTVLGRNGFKPLQNAIGGFDPNIRRGANQLGHTIAGEAKPNTLVRLVERISRRVIGEVLVDSSGLYTFDQVFSNPNGVIDYEILLYPNGIMTAEPERVNARFVSLPSQLQKGASTWIVSGGLNRLLASSEAGNFWGRPEGFAGGVSYRYGLFESLTLGAGLIYQKDRPQALAEFIYTPSWMPFYLSTVALNDFKTGKLDYNAQGQWSLPHSFSVKFGSNPLSKQAFLNWNPLYWLNFRAGGAINPTKAAGTDPKTWFAGVTAYGIFYETFASIDANFDSRSALRLNGLVYRDAWSAGYQHDELRNRLDLSYNFSDSNYARGNYGHSLNLGLERSETDATKGYFAQAGWHYRSESLLNDGRSLIDADLGYGIGPKGGGIQVRLATLIIPGVELSANYQDVSPVSGDRKFSLNLNTNFRVQPNLSLSNRAYTLVELRGAGGIFIQPFLDKNDNGQYDADDSIYTDNAERLLRLNGFPVARYSMEVGLQGLYLRQQPGQYRLDLDPSGYPVEGKPAQESYAVEVHPGAYTTIAIPFSVTYTIAGRVTDAEGDPVGGAKVEALPADQKTAKGFAVTNGAGGIFHRRSPPRQIPFVARRRGGEDRRRRNQE